MKKQFTTIFIFFLTFSIFAQTSFFTMPHKAEVTALFYDTSTNDGSFFSASRDGTIARWSPDGKTSRYQVTNRQIIFATIHPVNQEIAIYETNGNEENIISVWDWKTLTKKFSYSFSDSILSLTYSKKGTYLIAGTSTDKGTIFINSSSGSQVNPITDKMNMMSFIETSNSEKSIMTYSLTGSINYYSTESKKLTKKIPINAGFEKLLTFNKFMYVAGIKDKKLTIIDATNGKTVFELSTVKPVIFTYNDELYYIDNLSGNSGSIFKFNIEDTNVSSPIIYKNIIGGLTTQISNILILEDKIIASDTKGNIFTTDNISEVNSSFELLSIPDMQTIADLSFYNDELFLLSKNNLYKTDSQFENFTKIASNLKASHFVTYEDSLILWSQGQNACVYKFDFSSNLVTELFTTKGQLYSLKKSANQIIYIESSSTVKRYNFETGDSEELYYGTGIQDAVMLSSEDLLIAKSSANKIDSSLIYVNTRTHETLPLNVDVDCIYSVTNDENDYSENSPNKNAYLIAVKTEPKKNSTMLLSLNVNTKKIETLKTFNTLNFHAFEYAYNKNIYTNIDNFLISAFNVKNKKTILYKKGSSYPEKVTANNLYVAVLNQDGTFLIYENETGKNIAYFFITQDEQLIKQIFVK